MTSQYRVHVSWQHRPNVYCLVTWYSSRAQCPWKFPTINSLAYILALIIEGWHFFSHNLPPHRSTSASLHPFPGETEKKRYHFGQFVHSTKRYFGYFKRCKNDCKTSFKSSSYQSRRVFLLPLPQTGWSSSEFATRGLFGWSNCILSLWREGYQVPSSKDRS